MTNTTPEATLPPVDAGTISPLVTVQTLATRHPDACPVGGTRHILFHMGGELEETGIVVRVGRKILIDEPRYLDWLRSGGARNIRRNFQKHTHRGSHKGRHDHAERPTGGRSKMDGGRHV